MRNLHPCIQRSNQLPLLHFFFFEGTPIAALDQGPYGNKSTLNASTPPAAEPVGKGGAAEGKKQLGRDYGGDSWLLAACTWGVASRLHRCTPSPSFPLSLPCLPPVHLSAPLWFVTCLLKSIRAESALFLVSYRAFPAEEPKIEVKMIEVELTSGVESSTCAPQAAARTAGAGANWNGQPSDPLAPGINR